MEKTKQHYNRDNFNFDIEERKKYYLQDVFVFGRLIKKLQAQHLNTIVDVGCGVGTLSDIIKSHLAPYKIIGLDLSYVSLSQINIVELLKINGTNLALPFHDEISDLTISNGVIHHTPNPKQSFSELARITKKSGLLYLSVYNKGWYYIAYHTIGIFFTLLHKFKLSFLLHMFAMPPFYLAYILGIWVKCKKMTFLPWKMVWRMFSDQWITPQATFHTNKEMVAWGKEYNFDCIDLSKRNLGGMIDFLFIKR